MTRLTIARARFALEKFIHYICISKQRDSRYSESSLYDIDPPILSNPRASIYSRVRAERRTDEAMERETDGFVKATHHESHFPLPGSTGSRQTSTNLKRSTSFPVYYAPDVGAING